MPWRWFKGFVARRLSRTEYLGLHLTVGLVLSLLLALAYVGLAREVFTDDGVQAFDTRLGLQLKEHREAYGEWAVAVLLVTWLGAFEFMLVFVPMVGWLLWRHRRSLALVWLFAAMGGGLINQTLKRTHDRPRPEYKSASVHEHNQSFPSGHSTGSMITFGLLTYFCWLRWRSWKVRTAVTLAAALLILAIGFSRIYLGAHYFSDVLAGYCVGAAWLTACISAVEVIRRRRLALAPDAVTPNNAMDPPAGGG